MLVCVYACVSVCISMFAGNYGYLIIPRTLHISSVTRTMNNLVLKVVCLLSLVPAGTCEPLQSNAGERPSCYNVGASQKQTWKAASFPSDVLPSFLPARFSFQSKPQKLALFSPVQS